MKNLDNKFTIRKFFSFIIFAFVTLIPLSLIPSAYSLSYGGINLGDITDSNDLPGLDLFRGPQGEQGPKGDTGQQGPKGDNGPSKDLDTITVTKTALIEIENREVSVQCPDDRKVTGGGFAFDNSNTRTIVLESKPINNGWMIFYDVNQFQIPSEDSVTVYAQCAKLL